MKKTWAIILMGALCLECRLGAQSTAVLRNAAAQEAAGNVAGAIATLKAALQAGPPDEALTRKLYELNKKFYLTSVEGSGGAAYQVKAGDTLTSIARTHAITPELIMRLNGLKNDRLRRGQTLRIVKGPFDVRIVKQTYTLEIRRQNEVLFTYQVGLGKEDSTPLGAYTAGAKLKNPTQFDREKGKTIEFGAPDHTIGTRWITIASEYGIHGTVEPQSIGKQMSKGCIRMLNEDVEQVYDLLLEGKSKISIVPPP